MRQGGLAAAEKYSFKLVLTDLFMPDINGMDVLGILSTFPGDPRNRSHRIWNNRDGGRSDQARRLRLSIEAGQSRRNVLTLRRALEHKDLKEQNVALRSQILEQHRLERLIGQSPPMISSTISSSGWPGPIRPCS